MTQHYNARITGSELERVVSAIESVLPPDPSSMRKIADLARVVLVDGRTFEKCDLFDVGVQDYGRWGDSDSCCLHSFRDVDVVILIATPAMRYVLRQLDLPYQ